MGLIKTVKKVASKIKKKIDPTGFDMSSQESREVQVETDFYRAKNARAGQVTKWQTLDEYYNNQHYTAKQIQELVTNNNWNFTPPVLPDPYIQVEINIDPIIPEAEFIGRGEDNNDLKAKERQAVVDYIVYNNKVKQINTENERNLNKLGDAFWKVSFDDTVKGFGYMGDIVIGNPSPANIFPDPSAYDVEDAEYIIYAYRIHRRKAQRLFGKLMNDNITVDGFYTDTEIFERDRENALLDDTVQVVEYWFRDDEGDIGCSIQIDFQEVKFIPKYWKNTKNSGNQLYPFVKYCKIPVDMAFWDKGEIETIIDLVDAGDREFMSMLLSDMMQPADIIVYEDGALADGEELKTGPNATIKTAPNKVNAVRRLGGLTPNTNTINTIAMIHQKIEETTGTTSDSQGIVPVNGITTASGIAQINERSDARANIKKADRVSGFERLYELIDWSAMEFYNTDRIIQIRGDVDSNDGSFNNPSLLNNNQPLTTEQQQNMPEQMVQQAQQDPNQQQQQPQYNQVNQPQPKTIQPKKSFIFNSDNHRKIDKNKALALTKKGVDAGQTDEQIKQIVEENAYYYPKIDCQISVGEGVSKSLAFTLQVLQDLIDTPISVTNKEMVAAMIDLLNIPQKKDIKQSVMNFQPMVLPKETIAFKDLPLDGQVQMAAHAGLQLDEGDTTNGIVQGIAVQGSMPLAIDQHVNNPTGTGITSQPDTTDPNSTAPANQQGTPPPTSVQQPTPVNAPQLPQNAQVPLGSTQNAPQQQGQAPQLNAQELQALYNASPEQQQKILATLGMTPQDVISQVQNMKGGIK